MGDRVDLLHCPANTAPLVLAKRVKLVLTIHDVMYMFLASVLGESPSLYQRLGRFYRRLVVPLAARQATAIVTDSYNSRQDVMKYLGVEKDKLQVVREAPNSACRLTPEPTTLTAVRAKYALQRPFILALAAVDPRKNTARIAEAYALFRKQVTRCYQLALVGLTPAGQRHFQHLAQTLGLADEVITAGFVPDEDLVSLYNAAEALLYPSLYEGFGLPVLEAMACGTPVISSKSSSIPEIAGDAALLINPTDTEALARAMVQLSSDQELRNDLIARGYKQAAKFSWAKAAEEMLAVYEHALAK